MLILTILFFYAIYRFFSKLYYTEKEHKVLDFLSILGLIEGIPEVLYLVNIISKLI